MDTLLAEGNESFRVKYSHLPGRTWNVSSKWWLSLLTSAKVFPLPRQEVVPLAVTDSTPPVGEAASCHLDLCDVTPCPDRDSFVGKWQGSNWKQPRQKGRFIGRVLGVLNTFHP